MDDMGAVDWRERKRLFGSNKLSLHAAQSPSITEGLIGARNKIGLCMLV
jgi:hypothetical protein